MSDKATGSKSRWHALFFLIPFFVFLAFAAVAYIRISGTPAQTLEELPNALKGKQVPHTVLQALDTETATQAYFDTDLFRGRVTLVNFWGSWCPPCREEHPVLMTLANNPLFDLVGINYKDTEDNATRFLANFGNPFRVSGFDPKGQAAINWGVYGPPETFIISKGGIILYRHIGPITPDVFKEKLLPVILCAN